MLEFMRRRARSPWIKVIFFMIVIVFIFWGFGGAGRGSRADVVASVDGQDIPLKDFQRAYENLRAAYREAYKERLTPEMLETLNLKEGTLDQLVEAQLLEEEARRLGFTVDDGEVRQAIAARPEFQDNGQFNQNRYLRALRFIRATPGEYEEKERTQLLNKKLQNLITDAVEVSDDEVRGLFDLNQEKVSLSFLQIASSDFLDQVTVTPQEKEEFYNTHRESFRQPERVKFVYIAYPADHFESQVQVTTEDTEAFYHTHKADRFTTPPRIHARHILFAIPPDAREEAKITTRTTATEVLARVRAGEDFAMLAQSYSQDTATAPNGGDLGFFTRGRMVKPFEEAAFNLSVGGISDLVETDYGLHIIKVEAIEGEKVKSQAEVQDEIRKELTRTHGRERAREQADKDREKIQNGAAMDTVARESGFPLKETPLVARDETIPDIGRQPPLINAAFALTPSQVSEPVAVKDTWYLVSPREKVASTILEFAAVAEDAEKRAQARKAEKLAQEKANTLLARVKETKDLTAVAAAQKLKVEETEPFTRQGGYIPKIGSVPDLKKEAFHLTKDAPVAPQTYLWSGKAYIAMLKERIPPNAQDFDKQKKGMREELLRRKQTQAMEELLTHLKSQSTITYNHEALVKIP